MTTYNTAADAANTAVRAFLTNLGELYFKGTFNTSSGRGMEMWRQIREDVFGGECAYCGESVDRPSMEHLVMFNKEQCGLHHPGNVVPCCAGCNRRRKTD